MLYVWVVDVRRLWCRTYSCGIQDSGATTAGITNNDNLRSDGDDTVNFPHKEKACEESHCAWKKEQTDEYNKGCLPFTQKTRVEILFVYNFFLSGYLSDFMSDILSNFMADSMPYF